MENTVTKPSQYAPQYETISMMDLRKNVGAIINEVVYKGKSYLIERRGKPLCILDAYSKNQPLGTQPVPVSNVNVSSVNAKRLFGSLKHLSLSADEWTGRNSQSEQDYQVRIQQLWSTKRSETKK